MWLKTFSVTSPRSCTSTSSSTTTMHLVNIAWPSDQIAFITLRACPGYDFLIETIIRLWNTPSMGRLMSTSSGIVSFISGKKDALDRLAHVGIFLRRLPHDRGRVDRILAVRDAGDVKDGIQIFERVEAGVIAERALAAKFVEMHVAFEHDLAGGGHFEVDGFALHQIDRALRGESRRSGIPRSRAARERSRKKSRRVRCRWRPRLPSSRMGGRLRRARSHPTSAP